MFKLEELVYACGGVLVRPASRCGIIRSFSTDSRTIKKNDCFIALKGCKFDGSLFINEAIKKGAVCVIGERGSSAGALTTVPFIEVKDTVKCLASIANFNRRIFDIPVIAVTGSNGKTTVKEMAAACLSSRYEVSSNEGTKNNHIGLPQSLLKLSPLSQLGIFEMGTSNFGEIGYLAGICQPNAAIITNIGPSHLEYFKDLNGVFSEKRTLIDNLKVPGLAILNNDDPYLRKIINKRSRRPVTLSFGVRNKSDFTASGIKFYSDRSTFVINRSIRITLASLCAHNIYNALAAAAVARVFGISYKDISRRLSSFKFPGGRFNVFEYNKAVFIDDSYNSNPLSFGSALKALDKFKGKGRRIVIMGDMLELGQKKEVFHTDAGHAAASVCDVFISVGSLSKFAASAARESGIKHVFCCDSSREAGEILFNKIFPRRDDVVLVKGSRSMKMEQVFRKEE